MTPWKHLLVSMSGSFFTAPFTTQEVRYAPGLDVNCTRIASSAAEHAPVIQRHPSTTAVNLNGSVKKDLLRQARSVEEAQECRGDLRYQEVCYVCANLSSDVETELSSLAL